MVKDYGGEVVMDDRLKIIIEFNHTEHVKNAKTR